MGLKWTDIPEKIRVLITTTLIQTADELIEVELYNLLTGAAQMRYNWTESQEITEVVFRGIIHCYENRRDLKGGALLVSNIIHLLGMAGIKWEAIPNPVKSSCYNAIYMSSELFDSQQISTLVNG
jgi:hypothetical protein